MLIACFYVVRCRVWYGCSCESGRYFFCFKRVYRFLYFLVCLRFLCVNFGVFRRLGLLGRVVFVLVGYLGLRLERFCEVCIRFRGRTDRELFRVTEY